MALLNKRVHVGPHLMLAGATDWWLVSDGTNGHVSAASATNPYGLSGWGWTTTNLSGVIPGSADFMSQADDPIVGITFNANGDTLIGPRIFGDYAHSQVAKSILGYQPTQLCLEVFATWQTASANENTSFFGFTNVGGTDVTAGNCVAGIMSDGTNFRLKNASAGNDAGAAIDTSPHLWKIVVDATNTEWFIDGVSQGTITTATDFFPTAFKAITATTNRFDIGFVHVWYA